MFSCYNLQADDDEEASTDTESRDASLDRRDTQVISQTQAQIVSRLFITHLGIQMIKLVLKLQPHECSFGTSHAVWGEVCISASWILIHHDSRVLTTACAQGKGSQKGASGLLAARHKTIFLPIPEGSEGDQLLDGVKGAGDKSLRRSGRSHIAGNGSAVPEVSVGCTLDGHRIMGALAVGVFHP